MMEFYKRRIPWYAFWRYLCEGLLITLALASTLAAALKLVQYTAVIAAVATGIAGWQEFTATNKKLERYSTVAQSLSDILMWWQALPEEDQTSVSAAHNLVEWTENQLHGEHSAWLSDAQQAVKLLNAMGEKPKDEAADQQQQQQQQQPEQQLGNAAGGKAKQG